MATNFLKITENPKALAHYLAGVINGECNDKCPGYSYCNGKNCDIAIEEFLADDTLTTFKEANIGDRFKIINTVKNDNVYIKTGEITSSPEEISINCVNLKTGKYGYINMPSLPIRITKKCEE